MCLSAYCRLKVQIQDLDNKRTALGEQSDCRSKILDLGFRATLQLSGVSGTQKKKKKSGSGHIFHIIQYSLQLSGVRQKKYDTDLFTNFKLKIQFWLQHSKYCISYSLKLSYIVALSRHHSDSDVLESQISTQIQVEIQERSPEITLVQILDLHICSLPPHLGEELPRVGCWGFLL